MRVIALATVSNSLARMRCCRAHRTHRRLQLPKCKAVVQERHDLLDESVRKAEFNQLTLKQPFIVLRVRLHIGRRHEPRRGVEHDFAIAVDDTGTERDRGNMAFARRAQAENESL